MKKGKIKLFFVFLLTFFALVFVFSYAVKAQNFNSAYFPSQNPWLSYEWKSNYCNETATDFLVLIEPFSCSPSVVRSDLLAEQNVPVFCRLSAVKINPLIQVPYIKSVSITVENKSKEIAAVSFFPANLRLSYYYPFYNEFKEVEGIPTMNNLGYIQIILARQASEAEMPDKVKAKLKATIVYDVTRTYGINEHQFTLSLLSQEDWLRYYNKYSFWRGKGYVRLLDLEEDRAKIAVYTDPYSFPYVIELYEGETSDEILLPGFYCGAGVKVRLDEIGKPGNRARLIVNGNELLLKEGDKILDSDCYVSRIVPYVGYGGKVKIRCRGKSHLLEIKGFSAKFKVKDYKTTKEIDVGLTDPIVFFDQENKKNYVYVGWIGKWISKEGFYQAAILFTKEGKRLDEEKVIKITEAIHSLVEKEGLQFMEGPETGIVEKIKEKIKREGIKKNFDFFLVKKAREKGIVINDKEFFVALKSIEGPEQAVYPKEIEDSYKEAIEKLEDIAHQYADVKALEGSYFGVIALMEASRLALYLHKQQDQERFLKEIIDKYSNIPELSEDVKEARRLLSYTVKGFGNRFVVLDRPSGTYSVELLSIERTKEREYAIIEKQEEGTKERGKYYKEDLIEGLEITEIDDGSITLKNITTGREIVLGENEAIWVKNKKIRLVEAVVKKEVKVSILPFEIHRKTEANFTVTVGIEKRAIKLSPEKIEDKIKKIDEAVKRLEEINKALGKTISVWKKACFFTTYSLIIKNFITGLSGKALARKMVMEVWSELCSNPNFRKNMRIDECYRAHENEINQDIALMEKVLKDTNEFIKKVKDKEGVVKKTGLFSSQINVEKFIEVSEKMLECEGKEKEECEKLPNCEWKNNECVYSRINNVKLDSVIKNLKKLYENSLLFGSDIKELYLQLALYKECEGKDTELCKKTREKVKTLLESKYLKYVRNVEKEEKLRNSCGRYATILYNCEKPTANIQNIFSTTNKDFLEGFSEELKEKLRSYKDKKAAVVFCRTTGKAFLLILDVSLENYYSVIEKIPLKIENGTCKEGEELEQDRWLLAVKEVELSGPIERGPEKDEKANVIKFWEKGIYQGKVAYMPIDIASGWYFATALTQQPYLESGEFNKVWVCNVGNNHVPEFNFYSGGITSGSDDLCVLFVRDQLSEIAEALPNVQQFYMKAKRCVAQATQQFSLGKRTIQTDCGLFRIGRMPTTRPLVQCEDFFSPKECLLIYNLCDPVICPASRCDFGGRFPVDNVFATGIIGSIFLCLPNFENGKGVLVPICLTGLHAGIENLISILNATKSCLEENLKTGKLVGICDQATAFYLCELLWRELGPFLKIGLPSLTESLLHRGGNEYVFFNEAWKQAIESARFFSSYYAVESLEAFKARTVSEFGSEICKNFVSVPYPTSAKLIEQLAKPESPPQVWATLDEIPLGTPTDESHYKVHFHIYAGTDQGIYYSVFLRKKKQAGYAQSYPIFVVPNGIGYVPKGSYVDRTPDFIAPSGYKELCVRLIGPGINKVICGFKQVGTSFALEEIKDLYLKSQIEKEITTTEQCIGGTPTLLTPSIFSGNIQAMLEESLHPEIYKRGIIRICSSFDPNKITGKERWRKIGYCDDPNIGCWLDMESVEGAIKDLGIKEEIYNYSLQKHIEMLIEKEGYDMPEKTEKILNEEMKPKLIKLKESINNFLEKQRKAIAESKEIEKATESYYENENYKKLKEETEKLIQEYESLKEKTAYQIHRAIEDKAIADLLVLKTKLVALPHIVKYEREIEEKLKKEKEEKEKEEKFFKPYETLPWKNVKVKIYCKDNGFEIYSKNVDLFSIAEGELVIKKKYKKSDLLLHDKDYGLYFEYKNVYDVPFSYGKEYVEKGTLLGRTPTALERAGESVVTKFFVYDSNPNYGNARKINPVLIFDREKLLESAEFDKSCLVTKEKLEEEITILETVLEKSGYKLEEETKKKLTKGFLLEEFIEFSCKQAKSKEECESNFCWWDENDRACKPCPESCEGTINDESNAIELFKTAFKEFANFITLGVPFPVAEFKDRESCERSSKNCNLNCIWLEKEKNCYGMETSHEVNEQWLDELEKRKIKADYVCEKLSSMKEIYEKCSKPEERCKLSITSEQAGIFLEKVKETMQKLECKTNINERWKEIKEQLAEGIFEHWPTENYIITSCYGKRILNGKQDFHDGIDIRARNKKEVYAVASGTVKKVVNECESECDVYDNEIRCNIEKEELKNCNAGFGNTVVIAHDLGLYTAYNHLKEVNVMEGQEVREGQLIGYTDCTGNCEVPHLDFKVYINEADVLKKDRGKNPICFFSKEIRNRIVFKETLDPDTCFSNLIESCDEILNEIEQRELALEEMDREWQKFVSSRTEGYKGKYDCADFALQLLYDFANEICDNPEIKILDKDGKEIVSTDNIGELKNKVMAKHLQTSRSLETLYESQDGCKIPIDLELKPGDLLLYRFETSNHTIVVYEIKEKREGNKYKKQYFLAYGNMNEGEPTELNLKRAEYTRSERGEIKNSEFLCRFEGNCNGIVKKCWVRRWKLDDVIECKPLA